MLLVLAFCACVALAFGALLGWLVARHLSRRIVVGALVLLAAATLIQFVYGRSQGDYEQIGSDIMVFVILLPLLLGSAITGLQTRQTLK